MTTGAVDLTAWVGNAEKVTAPVRPGLDRLLRGTLDLPESQSGALLHGLHWLLFDEFSPAAETGPDGHPQRGGFLPPVDLPRRMWAGSRIEFLSPLCEGEEITRRRRVASVMPKKGKAGPLVFVTVQHEVVGSAGTLLREEQDLVYMNIVPAAPRVPSVQSVSETGRSRQFRPEEVTLFRYSALTSNSHRIHYDGEYARSTELYPALVVHGPLTATLLMWFTAQCAGDVALRTFAFRAVSPFYVRDEIRLEVDDADGKLEATARNPAGAVGMSSTATVVS